jgi:hypothetical protein
MQAIINLIEVIVDKKEKKDKARKEKKDKDKEKNKMKMDAHPSKKQALMAKKKLKKEKLAPGGAVA